jgi:hypothetical protein
LVELNAALPQSNLVERVLKTEVIAPIRSLSESALQLRRGLQTLRRRSGPRWGRANVLSRLDSLVRCRLALSRTALSWLGPRLGLAFRRPRGLPFPRDPVPIASVLAIPTPLTDGVIGAVDAIDVGRSNGLAPITLANRSAIKKTGASGDVPSQRPDSNPHPHRACV